MFFFHCCLIFFLKSPHSGVIYGVIAFFFITKVYKWLVQCIHDFLTAWKHNVKQHLIHLRATNWQNSSHSSNKSSLSIGWIIFVCPQQGLYTLRITHMWKKCKKMSSLFHRLQRWKAFCFPPYVLFTWFFTLFLDVSVIPNPIFIK